MSPLDLQKTVNINSQNTQTFQGRSLEEQTVDSEIAAIQKRAFPVLEFSIGPRKNTFSASKLPPPFLRFIEHLYSYDAYLSGALFAQSKVLCTEIGMAIGKTNPALSFQIFEFPQWILYNLFIIEGYEIDHYLKGTDHDMGPIEALLDYLSNNLRDEFDSIKKSLEPYRKECFLKLLDLASLVAFVCNTKEWSPSKPKYFCMLSHLDHAEIKPKSAHERLVLASKFYSYVETLFSEHPAIYRNFNPQSFALATEALAKIQYYLSHYKKKPTLSSQEIYRLIKMIEPCNFVIGQHMAGSHQIFSSGQLSVQQADYLCNSMGFSDRIFQTIGIPAQEHLKHRLKYSTITCKKHRTLQEMAHDVLNTLYMEQLEREYPENLAESFLKLSEHTDHMVERIIALADVIENPFNVISFSGVLNFKDLASVLKKIHEDINTMFQVENVKVFRLFPLVCTLKDYFENFFRQSINCSIKHLKTEIKALIESDQTNEEIKAKRLAIQESMEQFFQVLALINEDYPVFSDLFDEVFCLKTLKVQEPLRPSATKKKGKKKVNENILPVAKEKTPAEKAAAPVEEASLVVEEDDPVQFKKQAIRFLEITDELQKKMEVKSSSDDKDFWSTKNVKWKDLYQTLLKEGWKLVGSKGGHRQLKHPLVPEAGRVTVPSSSKDALSKGVVRNVNEQRAQVLAKSVN